MALRNYLVEELSGTGKSSVYDELIRRGHPAISTDRPAARRTAGGTLRLVAFLSRDAAAFA
jgi:serine kinase of HPr protein (carbohydrate metabolism regulator)